MLSEKIINGCPDININVTDVKIIIMINNVVPNLHKAIRLSQDLWLRTCSQQVKARARAKKIKEGTKKMKEKTTFFAFTRREWALRGNTPLATCPTSRGFSGWVQRVLLEGLPFQETRLDYIYIGLTATIHVATKNNTNVKCQAVHPIKPLQWKLCFY